MKRILTIIVTALMIIACVQTPEQEIVINKSDRIMEKAIIAPKADIKDYSVPSNWEETVSLKNFDIVFKASIELPETSVFPVYTIKRSTFTEKRVLDIINAIYPGNNMIRTNSYSKEEILYEMQMILRGRFGDVDDETGEIVWVPYEDETEQLASWNNMLAELPKDDSYTPLTENEIFLDGRRMVIQTEDQKLLYVVALPKMLKIGTNHDRDIQSENLVWSSGGYAGEKRHPLDNVIVSETEAGNEVCSLMNRLGIQERFGIASIDKARILEYVPEGFNVTSEGLLVELGLTAGAYLPTNYTKYQEDNFLKSIDADEEYAPSWESDLIQCYYDENGLQEFAWYDPIDFVLIANENVELMPFSEIQAHVRDYLRLTYAWTDEGNNFLGGDITINRMILSCTVTQIANQGDEAFLCPTWIVLYTNQMQTAEHHTDYVLLVNAIDGSCRKR